MRAKRALATCAAATLLVTGFDAATYASTGQSLILGHVNKAGQTTTVENTGKGAALKLVTKGGAPTARRRLNGQGAQAQQRPGRRLGR